MHATSVCRITMPGEMYSTGLAVGLKKGFIVEKRKLAPRPASGKGVRARAPRNPGPARLLQPKMDICGHAPPSSSCSRCGIRNGGAGATGGVCCSAIQCVAVCCNVLQCAAVCCNVLQCAAVYCSLLQCVAVCCSVLQCVPVCCTVMYYRIWSSNL